MTLKQFIEDVINDSVDRTSESPHLSFPIYVNGTEVDFGDISVTHKGTIEINIKSPSNQKRGA